MGRGSGFTRARGDTCFCDSSDRTPYRRMFCIRLFENLTDFEGISRSLVVTHDLFGDLCHCLTTERLSCTRTLACWGNCVRDVELQSKSRFSVMMYRLSSVLPSV